MMTVDKKGREVNFTSSTEDADQNEEEDEFYEFDILEDDDDIEEDEEGDVIQE